MSVDGVITAFDIVTMKWSVDFANKKMAVMKYSTPTKGGKKKFVGWTVVDGDSNTFNYSEMCTCSSSTVDGLKSTNI